MAWITPTDVAAGDPLTENLWNQDVVANAAALAPFFSAWTSWTPTLTQPGAITKTVTYAKYVQVGKLVIANFNLAVTGTGTGNNSVTVGLPVTAATTSLHVGGGGMFDASTSTSYAGTWLSISSTTIVFAGDWSGQNTWGVTPNLALANGDAIRGYLMYEAA